MLGERIQKKDEEINMGGEWVPKKKHGERIFNFGGYKSLRGWVPIWINKKLNKA